MCSTTGDAIDWIASAIDQVESDARATPDATGLTARIADLWLMVAAVDPELARRQQVYSAPAGGTPR